MKKIIYYFLILLFIIVVLPLIIVRGCSSQEDKYTIPEQKEAVKIKVYIKSEDKVIEVLLEDYIKEVVAAEMPAQFELEALKAQAVAARTYTLDKMQSYRNIKDETHMGADICTDSKHCQAWCSKQDSIKKWGFFSAYRNWNKIEKAVEETEGQVMVYKNEIVHAFFHSNSGGKTENVENVWNISPLPYLKSVQSDGEEASSNFKNEVSIKPEDFIEKIKQKHPDIILNEKVNFVENIKITSRSESGRVISIKVGNLTLKGTEMRELLELKSTNFQIEEENNILKITTLGYGHGVGMSQWGADYMAKNGATSDEILKYYYKGVEIKTINHLNIQIQNK